MKILNCSNRYDKKIVSYMCYLNNLRKIKRNYHCLKKIYIFINILIDSLKENIFNFVNKVKLSKKTKIFV